MGADGGASVDNIDSVTPFPTRVVTTIMFGTKTVTIFFTVNWSSTVWTQLQK
jgi:hypothetical protein